MQGTPLINTKSNNDIRKAAGGHSHLFPRLTERMIIMEMVTWPDIFIFVTMLVTILTYIDHKHKK